LRLTEKAGDGASTQTIRDVTEPFELELAAFHEMAANQVRPPTGIDEGEADIRVAQSIAAALAKSLNITLDGEASAP
jgi:hypothetical protein